MIKNRINKNLTFNEITDFLFKYENNYSKEYKLDRVFALFRELNIECLEIPCIHVTGTNGKGSTCSMLESIYRASGYKTGMFTSPHLVSITERMKINNINISEADFVKCFWDVYAAAETIKNLNSNYRISPFEYMTAMALLYFKNNNVDVIILEVGLGGMLDATNVVRDTLCSVFTSISLDHEEILGDTIEKIATDKAGIIKENHRVVLAPNIPQSAKEIIINIKQNSYSFHNNIHPSYQNFNATTALATINIMQDILPVKNTAINIGLETFSWPGRWQLLNNEQYPHGIIFDGAHNEDGAKMIVEELKNFPQKPILIFGSNKISRATKILNILLPYIDRVVFTRSKHPQSLKFSEITACINNIANANTKNTSDIKFETIEFGNLSSFIRSQNKLVLITGSLYLVGDAMACL